MAFTSIPAPRTTKRELLAVRLRGRVVWQRGCQTHPTRPAGKHRKNWCVVCVFDLFGTEVYTLVRWISVMHGWYVGFRLVLFSVFGLSYTRAL